MKNLKPYYDATNTADTHVREVAAQIDDLMSAGRNSEAVAMKDELEKAKADARSAHELYLSMRDISDADDAAPGRLVMEADPKEMTLGMSSKEIQNYSLLRAIRASAEASSNPRAWDAAGLELEASRAMEDKLGRSPQGFFVPWDIQISPTQRRGDAMRLRNTQMAGDPQTGGYLVQTELLSGSFIDVLRNKMVTRLAGATVLTGLVGDIEIPKKTETSSAYWIGEGTSPNKSTLKFGQIAARPRTIASYLQLTRKFLKQSSLDAEQMTRDDIAATIALGVDFAGLHGKGAANQPLGVQYTTGIGSVVGGENGASPDWGDVIDLETQVSIDNADAGALAYITNTKVRGAMKKTEKSSGTAKYIWEDGEMNGYPAFATNQVSSKLSKGSSTEVCSAIFFGNWADLVYAFWAGLDVIVDPYTNSTSGDVLITAMQDVDVVIRRPVSFAVMLDALTS